jgi:hypothetical protein
MSQQQAGGIVASSFIAGLLLTAAVFAPRAWQPVPEPFLESATVEPVAENWRPPRVSLDVAPGIAVNANRPAPPPIAEPIAPVDVAAEVSRRSARDLSHMAAVLSASPPERLAMREGPDAAESAAVTHQALPVVAATIRTAPRESSPDPTDGRKTAVRAITVSQIATDPVPEAAAEPAAAPESLKALVVRVQSQRPAQDETRQPRLITAPKVVETPGAAPLPGEPWTDPDEVNWSEPPAPTAADQAPAATARDDHPHTDAERRPPLRAGRIRDRLRVAERLLSRGRPTTEDATRSPGTPPGTPPGPPDIARWPTPTQLVDQLRHLAADAAAGRTSAAAWAAETLSVLDAVAATGGPRDAAAENGLLTLGEAVDSGMRLADAMSDAAVASLTRKSALALARRVAVWRAAAAVFAASVAQPEHADPNQLRQLNGHRIEWDIARLLDALERFETSLAPAEAAAVRGSTAAIAAAPHTNARAVARSVGDHYLAPNVRIAVHRQFFEKMLPETSVDSGPVNDVVLGRKVHGTHTVARSTTVHFIPDADEICFDVEVRGDISSRTVTESGPVSIASRGASTFTVRKPVKISSQGLLFGDATGVASNRVQLDGIQTSFDSVPVMRSLVRNIAKNQHEENLPEANREVIEKLVSRACREVDEQSEPKFAAIAERIRTKVWSPMERLGLEPTAVAMETTASVATLRLRLAAGGQLAAHTPRPRAPSDSQLSAQIHDSSINNACEQLGIAGRRLTLEELTRLVCERLGLDPTVPDDLPEGVAVTFATSQPLRIDCRDGLVSVRVALDALESGRRSWHDIVVRVAYRPTSSGPQVFLEREGALQLGGPNHQGRMEIALRTIFGKIFPKERPVPLLPKAVASNPRLADLQAVQTVISEGWLAIALAKREPAPAATAAEPQRKRLFR